MRQLGSNRSPYSALQIPIPHALAPSPALLAVIGQGAAERDRLREPLRGAALRLPFLTFKRKRDGGLVIDLLSYSTKEAIESLCQYAQGHCRRLDRGEIPRDGERHFRVEESRDYPGQARCRLFQ